MRALRAGLFAFFVYEIVGLKGEAKLIRPPAIGTQTMVTSPHYLATMAGARILDQGGNAFDAAVAVSACLAVVYPHMTGIGGDAFWLMYTAHDGAVRAYNASGRSGYRTEPGVYAGREDIPVRGPLSAITVPGMVDGWDAVLREYGKLTLKEVLEPAIQYAKEGFPCSRSQHQFSSQFAPTLQAYPHTARIYLPGGRPPSFGEKFVQRELADTLSLIAKEGRTAFYEGEIAASITAELKQQGGILTREDFADHTGNWVEPISTDYRGYTVYQMPPNSQGFAALMALNILKNFDLQAAGHGTFAYYHLLIEALKLSFVDRNRHLTDPDFYDVPLSQLLSAAYANKLAQTIRMDRAQDILGTEMGSDTAYAAVVDEEGNAVSFIQSLYFEFGSAWTAGETGVLLQNRGSFFSLDPHHINRLEPRKRTFHTLMPALAMLDDKPAILYGTQGGEGQPQTQTAIITRMIDFGMDPQQAVSLPRWLWGRTWGEKVNDELKLEKSIGESVGEQLAQVGHRVRMVEDHHRLMGHACAIRIDEYGYRQGGADPRSDGLAIGW